MSDEKVTIGGALSYAWSLWMENWRAIWGVLAFYAVSITVFEAGQLAHDPNLMLAGGVAAMIVSFAAYGAVFRIAFAKEAADRPDFKLGALGLQWRGMEWRMLGATLLVILFFVLVGLIVLAAGCAVVAGMVIAKGIPLTSPPNPDQLLAALGPVGNTTVLVVFTVLYGVIIFFAGRLALTTVASAVSGRIQVLKTWPLTRGHFWVVVFTLLAVELPMVLLGMGTVSGGDFAVNPAPPAIAFAIALAVGALSGAWLLPMLAGAMAYLYRNLRTRA